MAGTVIFAGQEVTRSPHLKAYIDSPVEDSRPKRFSPTSFGPAPPVTHGSPGRVASPRLMYSCTHAGFVPAFPCAEVFEPGEHVLETQPEYFSPCESFIPL